MLPKTRKDNYKYLEGESRITPKSIKIIISEEIEPDLFSTKYNNRL